MNNFLSAVPEQLKDVWYLYDLALLAVIGLCILALVFLRKRSNLKEAEKSLKTAKNLLRRAKTGSQRRRKFLLFSAKNVLNSSEYHYSRCISEEDKYAFLAIVKEIKSAIEKVDELMKEGLHKPEKEFIDDINNLLGKL